MKESCSSKLCSACGPSTPTSAIGTWLLCECICCVCGPSTSKDQLLACDGWANVYTCSNICVYICSYIRGHMCIYVWPVATAVQKIIYYYLIVGHIRRVYFLLFPSWLFTCGLQIEHRNTDNKPSETPLITWHHTLLYSIHAWLVGSSYLCCRWV